MESCSYTPLRRQKCSASERKIPRDLPARSALHAGSGPNSVVNESPPSQHRIPTGRRLRECSSVRFVFSCRPLLALLGFAAMSTVLAQPAAAGMEEAVKAMQANDLATAEKELTGLIKERDPGDAHLAGL